MQNVNLL